MTTHSNNGVDEMVTTKAVPSKDMAPMPGNFAPIFFQNQFRTTIELPTKEKSPNVEGKCAIITGANTGLGFEASKQLLSLGLSHLIIGVRSVEKGTAAMTKLKAANPSAKIEVWELEMQSYKSIQTFVRRCEIELSQIDIVILNAGLALTVFETDPETGHERTIQVNYLGTMFLTVLLIPVLKSKSKSNSNTSRGADYIPPRITIVNSVTAHLCKFPNRSQRPLLSSFSDTTITPWDANERYGVSKLLGQLFIAKLVEKVDSEDVVINMVDPGLTKGTGLSQYASGIVAVLAKLFFMVAGRPVERGAATYVDAALGHEGRGESHGCFLMNCEIAPLACWYYTDGSTVTEPLWSETLEEFSRAGAGEAIAFLRKDH